MAMTFEEWEKANGGSAPAATTPPLTANDSPPNFDDWIRAQNPIEQAKQDQTWWERINTPNQPEPMDLLASGKRVLMAGGIGGALAAPTGVGIPMGVASGIASGLAEEFAGSLGASDLLRFGAGMAGGEAPVAMKAAANMGHNLISAYNYRLGRLTGALSSKADREKAILQMQQKVYGKPYFELGYTTKNTDEAQIELSKQFLNGDIPLDGKVSDTLRQNLYDDVRGLQNKMESVNVPDPARKGWLKGVQEKNPTYFSTSHWGYSALEDLKDGLAQGKINRKEFAYIQNLLKSETGERIVPRQNFAENMLRLIQNGGERITGRDSNGTVQLESAIGEEAQKILRSNFDDYLLANTNKDQYNTLKWVEQQEGIARSRDMLPTLLQEGMKPSNPSYKKVVGYLSASPEGKQEFAKALMQKFGGLQNSKQMISEFNRMAPALRISKMMTGEQLGALRKKAESFDRKVDNQEAFNFWFKQALVTPLMSTIANEAAQQVTPPKTPMKSVYSL